MSKKRRILIGIVVFAAIGILGQTSRVEAALQANGGTPITANLNDWVGAVRQMKSPGGTLGLTDTINSNLTSSNKNLDIHMQKNTEYGAMAILSASAYGNPNKITDGQTTTGNASGIQIKLNGEWTAAGPNNTLVTNMKNAAGRYWNDYGTGNGSNSKKGDAMAETEGWHGSTGNTWLLHKCGITSGVLGDCAFSRGGTSLFEFSGQSYNCSHDGKCNWQAGNAGHEAWYYLCEMHSSYQSKRYDQGCLKKGFYRTGRYGRACVVVGSGV